MTDIEGMILNCGFEPIRKIGQGTFNEVWNIKYKDKKDKILKFQISRKDNKGNEKAIDFSKNYPYLTEIDILTRIKHPYISSAYKIITLADCDITYFGYIQDLADSDLSKKIKQKTFLFEQKVNIIYKLANALHFLHQNNIIHMDIKPENILIKGDNDIFIDDFNTCRYVSNIYTDIVFDSVRGTPIFLAPEDYLNPIKYSYGKDVWAFGILCIELFTDTLSKLYDKILSNYKKKKDSIIQSEIYSNVKRSMTNLDPEQSKKIFEFVQPLLRLEKFERPRFHEIIESTIFNNIKKPISSYTEHSIYKYPLPYNFSKYISQTYEYCKSYYSDSRVELLFLSINLLSRYISLFKNIDNIDMLYTIINCIIISAKLLYKNTPDTIESFVYIFKHQTLNISVLKQNEIIIISKLKGKLNVNDFYNICEDEYDINFIFNKIILQNQLDITHIEHIKYLMNSNKKEIYYRPKYQVKISNI